MKKRDRQTEKDWGGTKKRTKRSQWKDSVHSSQLIGELVRLMDREKDCAGRGQLIRIRPH